MNPRVRAVRPLDDFQLAITFTNGETGRYDCSPQLGFGVFAELKDEHYFRQVFVTAGTVGWPHEQDICPDALYVESRKRPAPTDAQASRH